MASGLTGQYPRISVSVNHISGRDHCARPLIYVPGPLLDAIGQLFGRVRSCAYWHGHAKRDSFVVKLHFRREVARRLFLPLQLGSSRAPWWQAQGWGREYSNRYGGKEEGHKGVKVER
jgi:hypothetical protein